MQVWFIPFVDEMQGVQVNCVIPWQRVLYLSALKTLRVEALYKSTTFTFFLLFKTHTFSLAYNVY